MLIDEAEYMPNRWKATVVLPILYPPCFSFFHVHAGRHTWLTHCHKRHTCTLRVRVTFA